MNDLMLHAQFPSNQRKKKKKKGGGELRPCRAA